MKLKNSFNEYVELFEDVAKTQFAAYAAIAVPFPSPSPPSNTSVSNASGTSLPSATTPTASPLYAPGAEGNAELDESVKGGPWGNDVGGGPAPVLNVEAEQTVMCDSPNAVGSSTFTSPAAAFLPASPPELYMGDCPLLVMQLIAMFAQDFFYRPRPLTLTFDLLTPTDHKLLQRANDAGVLILLYDATFLLGFSTLKDVCAVYLSHLIDNIAVKAANPLEGAEEIRKLLHMPNEWTEEEMNHLRKEMELAIEVDPKAY